MVRYGGLLNFSQSKGYRRLTHPTSYNSLSSIRQYWLVSVRYAPQLCPPLKVELLQLTFGSRGTTRSDALLDSHNRSGSIEQLQIGSEKIADV
jgi:hypothetical protein